MKHKPQQDSEEYQKECSELALKVSAVLDEVATEVALNVLQCFVVAIGLAYHIPIEQLHSGLDHAWEGRDDMPIVLKRRERVN